METSKPVKPSAFESLYGQEQGRAIQAEIERRKLREAAMEAKRQYDRQIENRIDDPWEDRYRRERQQAVADAAKTQAKLDAYRQQLLDMINAQVNPRSISMTIPVGFDPLIPPMTARPAAPKPAAKPAPAEKPIRVPRQFDLERE